MAVAFARRGPDLVLLKKADDGILATIPFEFLTTGQADTNTVNYLREVIQMLADVPNSFKIIRDGSEELGENLIVLGTYQIKCEDITQFHLRPGPIGKSTDQYLSSLSMTSSISHSSRNSYRQSKFRGSVLFRDTGCIITGEVSEELLAAAHIVPYSLGESFLRRITTGTGLYNPNNGVCLTHNMHKLFDRYSFGIYVSLDGRYFVHVFESDQMSLRRFHGKEISFRPGMGGKIPHPDLLAWHYQQCIMTWFRAEEA